MSHDCFWFRLKGVNGELADAFEAQRPGLVLAAYRLLGSVADAEDVVQDAFLRLERSGTAEGVRDLRAYLLKTVTRLSYDLLGSARARRELYVGPWLPEPLVEEVGPADRVTLDESVSMALMVVLEQLTPAERTAFMLHGTFGMPFEEIGQVVGRTPAAVRQLASRARRKVTAARPRAPVSGEEHLETLAAFAVACSEGDLEGLLALLDPDVVWRVDGGGKAAASLRPQRGAERIAKALISLNSKKAPTGRVAMVNGAPGGVIVNADGEMTVVSITVDGGRIVAIDYVRNPDKLVHVAPATVPGQRS